MHEGLLGSRFLREALPLVSSYFSGESVALADTQVSIGVDTDHESRRFASQLRLRHALTCSNQLMQIVRDIESRTSSVNQLVRMETKGVLRGRLDIPRYVARRAYGLSWPKTYPILVTEESPSTPENALVKRVFQFLLARLSWTGVDTKSAELLAARRSRRWVSNRIVREPWSSVATTSSIKRLHSEAMRRISRRQTGNDRAYSELLDLVQDWQLFGTELGGAAASDRLVTALLAFPEDEAFLDRIYEIWCIREIARCLQDLGASVVSGPISLTGSRDLPVYELNLAGHRLEIWFQLALNPGDAKWTYQSNGQGLRGIPDITIVANGTHRLVFDAKNRLVAGRTRSEETYKMLGYFENFRSLLEAPTNWGAVAFISENSFARCLISNSGKRLHLLSAHPYSEPNCQFRDQCRAVLSDWINHWRSAALN